MSLSFINQQGIAVLCLWSDYNKHIYKTLEVSYNECCRFYSCFTNNEKRIVIY